MILAFLESTKKKFKKKLYIFACIFEFNNKIMLCFKWENSYYNEKLRQRSRDCLPLKLYMWHNLRFKNEKHHLCFFISKSVLQFQR
jgi:hypothetical protein